MSFHSARDLSEHRQSLTRLPNHWVEKDAEERASHPKRHADDAILSLATPGASARPEPVFFLGTRAFVHGDVDNCLERSAP